MLMSGCSTTRGHCRAAAPSGSQRGQRAGLGDSAGGGAVLRGLASKSVTTQTGPHRDRAPLGWKLFTATRRACLLEALAPARARLLSGDRDRRQRCGGKTARRAFPISTRSARGRSSDATTMRNGSCDPRGFGSALTRPPARGLLGYSEGESSASYSASGVREAQICAMRATQCRKSD